MINNDNDIMNDTNVDDKLYDIILKTPIYGMVFFSIFLHHHYYYHYHNSRHSFPL